MQHFTIGDSHIICRKDQISVNLNNSLDYIINISKKLGLYKDITFMLSSGISRMVNLENNKNEWIQARQYLLTALCSKNITFSENGNSSAFYGPKIDVFFNSYNDKNVSLFTLQLDFQLPPKFNLTYTNEDNKKEYPVVIHRSSMSSYERMLGVLLEKYKGDLPFWLAPLQIKIFIIDMQCIDYGNYIQSNIVKNGFRVKSEIIKNSKLFAKIRDEIVQKTHFIVVIGRNEKEEGNLSVRFYHDIKTKETVSSFV